MIRILMDLPELTGIDREVQLGRVLTPARELFASLGSDPEAETFAYGFWLDRVRFALEQRGIEPGEGRAVLNIGRRSGQLGDRELTPAELVDGISPLRVRRMAYALRRLRGSEDLTALAVLFKRVKNIARELTDVRTLERGALTEPAELALLAELDARRPAVATALAGADYTRALTEIAALRPVVDRFFIEVFVMADDARVRTARLTLMAQLRDLILDLADISEIVPQTE